MNRIIKFLLLSIVLIFLCTHAYCQKTYKSDNGLTLFASMSSNSIIITIPACNNYQSTFYYDSDFMGVLFYKNVGGLMISVKDNCIVITIGDIPTPFFDVSVPRSSSDQRVLRTKDGTSQLVITRKMYQEKNTKGFGPSYYTRSYYNISIDKLQFSDDFYYQEAIEGGYLHSSKSGNIMTEFPNTSQGLEQINIYIRDKDQVVNFFGKAQVNSSGTGGGIIQSYPLESGSRTENCYTCNGNKRCPICKGVGYRLVAGDRLNCSACSGSGVCYKCYGTGTR